MAQCEVLGGRQDSQEVQYLTSIGTPRMSIVFESGWKVERGGSEGEVTKGYPAGS
jgi:hypothetical protein